MEGVVKLNGEPPALPKRPVTQDKQVCGIGDTTDDESLIVVKATKGIANAVVTLELKAGGAKPAPAAAAIAFDQHKCLFSEHVLVITENSTVDFKNSDTVAHNVNVKAQKNKGFNKTIAGKESVQWKFEREERIPVECNVHPWMKGWIVVTDAPYHAKTDAQGHFKIVNVPPGEYKVKVWQEMVGAGKKCWEGPAEVKVEEGKTATIEYKGTLAPK